MLQAVSAPAIARQASVIRNVRIDEVFIALTRAETTQQAATRTCHDGSACHPAYRDGDHSLCTVGCR